MKSRMLFLMMFFAGLPLLAKPVCVNRAGALLHAAPSASSPVSWKAPKYMPLNTTGVMKKGWLEVTDLDGDKHWLNRHDFTAGAKCLVVRARAAKLRTGPGANFEVANLGVADRYSSFLDRGGEDGWVEIQNDQGQKGWINLDLVWKPTDRVRLSFAGE